MRVRDSLAKFFRPGKSTVPLLASVIIGAALTCAPLLALRATDSTTFCVSCHSMRFPLADAMHSAHFNNDHGVVVACPDCHVPHALGPYLKAKVLAAGDVYHEIAHPTRTRADYDAKRPTWAARTRAKFLADDSAACRHCHRFEAFATPVRAHARAAEQHITCIVCHYNLVHGDTPWPEMENEL